MAKTLGARKLRNTRDIDTSAIERKRMIGTRAKEILRQGPSLMTQAEAVSIAKRQMAEVDKLITKDKRIKGAEAKAIHRLLAGRH
jgi:hypothetical protein